LKFEADFHSKMSVCRHELVVNPPTLNSSNPDTNSSNPYIT